MLYKQRALSARWNAPVKDKKHWMDYALETTDVSYIYLYLVNLGRKH